MLESGTNGWGFQQAGRCSAMKLCVSCQQQNPDDALSCSQCGTRLGETTPQQDIDSTSSEEARLWRAFIGPNDERYLQQFRKFTSAGVPRFALTWHWPAFLFDPFLWFLYRKMYVYAFIYAVGPILSAYLTQDFTVGIVWRIIAGASANYIYYWHVKEQLEEIRRQAGLDVAARERLLQDRGGVQPYVIWLGVALHLILLGALMGILLGGPDRDRSIPRSLPGSQRGFF
jgi:hypothetical protein